MAKYPKKRDLRITTEMDDMIVHISKMMSETTGLKIKPTDVVRAAISRYITDFNGGAITGKGSVYEEFIDGKEK